MPIVTSHYTLDFSKLPSKSDTLHVRFATQLVNGKNRLLLIYPNAEPGFEPAYVRYATGLKLQADNGAVATGAGQLVVTGQRLFGMITDGSVGNAILKEATGSVYAFSFSLDDMSAVETRKNWLGKPAEALIRSREGLRPAFLLHIFSVVASVRDDGQVIVTTLPALLDRLTPEGRRALQK